MLAFLLVAQSFGVINQYFEKEASEKDFWDAPGGAYHTLNEEAKQQWFMINPEKLKAKYRIGHEAFIVNEGEKWSLLKAFEILYEYSRELPENADFKERLLVAKCKLPPGVFPSKERIEGTEGCKVIPFRKI